MIFNKKIRIKMKLLKLSLVASVLALSQLSAAPLEEAIKEIDVSGFGRYRFQSDSKKGDLGFTDSRSGYKISKDRNTMHNFTLSINFKASLDDNFFSVIALHYDSRDTIGSHARGASGIANTHGGLDGVNGSWGGSGDSFSVRQYYVGFTGLPYTTVLFGRQVANTFFTDNVAATGLKVVANPLEGLSLLGLFYTNIERDEDLGGIPFDFDKKTGYVTTYIHQKNIWGLAAVYQDKMFDLQAWYVGANKVANLFALSAGISYDITSDVTLRAKAQWAYTSMDNEIKNNYDRAFGRPKGDSLVGNSHFLAFDLGASLYGFCIDAGYIQFGKDNEASIHTLEDVGSLIDAGEVLISYANFSGKQRIWFAKAIYTYDAYSIGVDYVSDKIKNAPGQDEHIKAHEWVIRAAYKYNSKLDFYAWYSMTTQKYDALDFATGNNNRDKFKFNRLRFVTRYRF